MENNENFAIREQAKPIFLDDAMVKKVLSNEKSELRHIVKQSVCYLCNTSPFDKGDFLYIRETWGEDNHNYLYKNDYSSEYLKNMKNLFRWQSSLTMPKKAARIFLRITNIRIEHLQDISDESVYNEGFNNKSEWINYWDTRMKKTNKLNINGWNNNPMVWVYEVEKIEI